MKNSFKTFATIMSLLSSNASRSSSSPTRSASALSPTMLKQRPTKKVKTSAMNGWSSTWQDILNGGSPRWKITDEESHEKAYAQFRKHVVKTATTSSTEENNADETNSVKNISVLCPLAGDDPFVRLLYRKGYSVTAIDLVEEAVDEMRRGFGDDENNVWTREESEGDIIWKHANGRATLIVGDALRKRPHLNKSFDAVYDKDSFGALSKDLRKPFCDRIAEYTKDNAIVYLECKLKKSHLEGTADTAGPPFSLRKDDLMDENNYGGSKFEYIEGLGPIYELPGGMNAVMQQTGHVLRRTRMSCYSNVISWFSY